MPRPAKSAVRLDTVAHARSRAATPPTSVRLRNRPQCTHIRLKPSLDSDTYCGGSHSDIWKRSLKSVAPKDRAKADCKRCWRVYNSPKNEKLRAKLARV